MTRQQRLIHHDNAVEDYSRAIIINPNYTDAYYRRGRTYYSKLQYDKAIDDFNKVISIDPKHADAYYSERIKFVGMYGSRTLYGCVNLRRHKACDYQNLWLLFNIDKEKEELWAENIRLQPILRDSYQTPERFNQGHFQGF